MKHVMRMALMVGVAVGAWAVSSDRGYTQAADPNAAPNRGRSVRNVGAGRVRMSHGLE
jgi:hypothetical protein